MYSDIMCVGVFFMEKEATEIYTLLIDGDVRCVELGSTAYFNWAQLQFIYSERMQSAAFGAEFGGAIAPQQTVRTEVRQRNLLGGA